MNAQKLWQGSDYAYGYKAKGATKLPVNLKRVKVMEVIKKPPRGYGKTKDVTVVKVMLLNDDGMPPDVDNPEIIEVGSREIIEHWDEYIETVDDEREEYFEKERQREIERKEAERKRQEGNAVYYIGYFLRGSWQKELRLREEAKKLEHKRREEKLHNLLIGRGIKADKLSVGSEYVSIKFEEMERWLGISNAG